MSPAQKQSVCLSNDTARSKHMAFVRYTWFQRGFERGATATEHCGYKINDPQDLVAYDEGVASGRAARLVALSAAAARYGHDLNPLRKQK